MRVPATNLGLSIPHAGLLAYSLLEKRRPVYVPPSLGLTKSGGTSMVLNFGGSLLTAAAGTGPAAPVVAAIGAVLMLGAQIAKMFNGCGPTCNAATDIANQWSDLVNQMKATYWNTPAPRYKSLQTATLQQLEQAAEGLRQACGDPALKEAGQRCISERVLRGGTAPWCPTPDHKGCDFYTTIYDPIANDANVVDDPAGFSEELQSVGIHLPSGDATGFLLLGGLGLLLLLML